jgi:hypothetical protein
MAFLLLVVEIATIAITIGETIYMLLNRPKFSQSPLQDLQVSSGADGAAIPFGFGTMRFGGEIIWAPGIKFTIVHSGKKGGPSLQGYVYTASFACAWGEGPGSMNRIWGDTKLIYKGGLPLGQFAPWSAATAYIPEDLVSFRDPNNSNILFFSCLIANTGISPQGNNLWWTEVTGQYPPWDGSIQYVPGAVVSYGTGTPPTGQLYAAIAFTKGDTPSSSPTKWKTLSAYYGSPTIYTGIEAQLPDPLIQAAQGATKTPAFRPLIYAVWDTFPLANFGNRIPNLRAEVTYA